MALPAPKPERDWPLAAPADGRASATHDPVAEMHRTLAAKLRLDASAGAIVLPGPVERIVRHASRAAGWATLAATAAVTIALVF